MKRKKQFSFSTGRALWQQRQKLFRYRPRLVALSQAVNAISDSGLSQYAQVFTTVLEFQPNLIIELGRGYGNSPAVLTEAANQLPQTRSVVSICLSNDWQEKVSQRIAKIVPSDWFTKLDARTINIFDVEIKQLLKKNDKVLFVWDAHGWDVAECVLGSILPTFVGREHLVMVHDLMDIRHHTHLRDYKHRGIWRGYNEDNPDGPYLVIDTMASAFEEVIPLHDFLRKNDLSIHSVEHEVRETVFSKKEREAEFVKHLGREMGSPTSSWHWFSLNEKPPKTQFFFPDFKHPLQPTKRPTIVIPQRTNRQPLVSIVTPCFNSAKYLTECIESVLAQDYPLVEHIIQDGASTDMTAEILRKYSASKYRKRIKWVSEPDHGQADGLNKALQRAKGEILLVLNADDVLMPGACGWGVNKLQKHPEAAVVYGDEYFINDKSEITNVYVGKYPYSYERLFCVELVPPAQAAFIRRRMFQEVGLFADASLATCPDFEMWVRIGAKFPMQHEFGMVSKYRHHQGSEGDRPEMVAPMVKAKLTVINRTLVSPHTPISILQLKRRAYAGLYHWGAMVSGSCGAYKLQLYYLLLSFWYRPQLHKLIRMVRFTFRHLPNFIKNLLQF